LANIDAVARLPGDCPAGTSSNAGSGFATAVKTVKNDDAVAATAEPLMHVHARHRGVMLLAAARTSREFRRVTSF
jgi:hypothetical protein